MVHGGILKHCRVVVTTIKVSLHDDDDEMMMVMTMRMRRARVVVTVIKVSHNDNDEDDDGDDEDGGDTNQGESYRDRKQVGGLGRETGVGVECAGCSGVECS